MVSQDHSPQLECWYPNNITDYEEE